MTPEERYQARKGNCCWHESGWSHRRLDAYDGQGCNQFTGCIPECRFYPQYGRIEDEEVIKENRQAEEYYRKRNMIVNIDIAANYNDYQEVLENVKFIIQPQPRFDASDRHKAYRFEMRSYFGFLISVMADLSNTIHSFIHSCFFIGTL